MNNLQVGYGRVNITPNYPVAIAGSAANKVSQGYLDPIYITCLAFRYGEETLMVATMDLVGAYAEYAAPARTAISQATGLPEDRVILNATHTHSSVGARNIDGVGIARYREEFYAWVVEAAKTALADLTPAEVWYGSTQTQGMVWVRHYKMADGTFAGANYGSFKKSTIVGHASEAFGEVQLVKFARAAANKKDILMMNYPAHATMQKELYISADFPGPAREYIEENTGVLVAYFIAAAGDQVPTSRIPEEQFSADYKVYGQEVGRIVVTCMESLTKLDQTQLRFAKHTFTGKSNKAELDRLDQALAVRAIWEQVGGRGTPEGKAAAKEHGFSSVYQVTAILNRMNFPDERSMELKTMAIGNVGFVLAPYEMFGASSAQIKKASPYDMTFIISCSQNHDGYLPSKFGWSLGCYESQITRFAPGTAEQLADTYVSLLKQMKEN